MGRKGYVSPQESSARRLAMGARLDRVLEVVAPRLALARRKARWALAATSGYASDYLSANSDGRLRRSPRGGTGSGDKHLDPITRQRLRNDARDLDRNNCIAEGLVNRSVENIVQTGFAFQAMTDDEGLGGEAEARWALYEQGECSADGRTPLWELCQLLQRSKTIDGDVGGVQLDDGALQVAEADRITQGRGISDTGIETDERGRILRVWICNYNAYGYPDPSKAAPKNGNDVYLLRHRKRASASRGASMLGTTTVLFERLDEYLEAVVVGAIVGACQATAITTEEGGNKGYGRSAPEKDNKGNIVRVQEVEPGSIHYLQPGEDVKNISPSMPTQEFTPFVQQLMRFAGLHLGLPLELAGLDFSEANYSSCRAALLQAYLKFQIEQQALMDMVLMPMAIRRMRVWKKELGWTEPKEALARRKGWRQYRAPDGEVIWLPRFVFMPPRWRWVDPLKEVQAADQACASGIQNLAIIGGDMGMAWQDMMDQRVLEIARAQRKAASLGGDVSWRDVIPNKRGASPAPAGKAGPDEPGAPPSSATPEGDAK